MKMSGLSLAEIGAQLDIAAASVGPAIQGETRRNAAVRTDEERQDVLDMENARWDYYLSKLWPSIEYGDIKAILAALKISELRIKANRVDQPTSVQTNQVLVIGGEQADYIERLKQLTDG